MKKNFLKMSAFLVLTTFVMSFANAQTILNTSVNGNGINKVDVLTPPYSDPNPLPQFYQSSRSEVTIGTGTLMTERYPIYAYFGYSYTQSIFLQSEIGQAGNITKVSYYFNGASLANSNNWTIYIGHTTKSSFASNTDWEPLTNLTQVYSGIFTNPSAPGWIEFTLTTPFSYNNTDNLVIAVDENAPNYDNSGDRFYNSTVTTGRSLVCFSDTNNPDPASPPTAGYAPQLVIPNVKLMIGAPATNDVAISTIIAPTTPIVPGSVVPQVTVMNYGTAAQTNVPVKYKIGTSGTVNTFTIPSLAAGASTNVSFPAWNATNGSYDFIFYTDLAGDENHVNDTMKRTVTVTDAVWTAGAPTSLLSYLGSAAGCGGKLYAMGGNQTAAAAAGVAIYDVNANTWAAGPSLPGNRVIGMAAGTSTKVYYMGGSDGTNYTNTVWELTPPGTTWAVKATLPVNLGWAKTAVYQDSLIYVMGGVENGATAVGTVYLYNTVNDTWRTCTPIPEALFGGVGAINGNTLVWSSGSNLSAASTNTYRGVIDPTNHALITWTLSAPIPLAAFKADGGTWTQNNIIFTAGCPTGWTPTSPSPCYTYDVVGDVWTPLPNKTTATLGSFISTFDLGATYRIVCASGYTGSACTPNTEYLSQPNVGIRTNSVAKFSLYPNPVSDMLNIASDKVINNVKVYNISGQLVYSSVVKDVKTQINTSNLSNGMYMIQIESNDGISVQKFNVAK